jgi:Protein of unknown function (DUF2851)
LWQNFCGNKAKTAFSAMLFSEKFLQFVWQYQHFNTSNLHTTAGEQLRVFKTGRWNTHAGPDFEDARLSIGGVEWAGSVEIHLRASDWYVHTHEQNLSYNTVILHVVWQADQAIRRADGTEIPTLEIAQLVDQKLVGRYQDMLHPTQDIPCVGSFVQADYFLKVSMLDKILLERLQAKSQQVLQLFAENKEDWEATTYQYLAQAFGFKLNGLPFLQLAQRTPLKILQKHRDQPHQIEALVFGMAGLLDEPPIDDYQAQLQKEYYFLSNKYQIKHLALQKHEWKFLRLRPANFPTIRLAQWAQLLSQNAQLFSMICHLEDPKTLVKVLKIQQSPYWRMHYVFGKTSRVADFGLSSVHHLVLNAVVPILVAYSTQRAAPAFLEKAIRFLEILPPEKNHITQLWQRLGLRLSHAGDTQASLTWYNDYCQAKRCLECQVGRYLLNQRETSPVRST